jgi:hypothetical protein
MKPSVVDHQYAVLMSVGPPRAEADVRLIDAERALLIADRCGAYAYSRQSSPGSGGHALFRVANLNWRRFVKRFWAISMS